MFLSVDIGGTKTLLALFSYHGLCLRRRRFPTTKNPDVYLADLRENLELLLDSSRLRKKILAITIGIPGKIIITKNSYTFLCPNIPWSEINLYETIKNLFPTGKIFFANDANLATLYETSRLSPTDRLKKTIYLTFSTGIGGGISENGRLLPRSDLFEPGHKKYLFNPTTTALSPKNPMSENVTIPSPNTQTSLSPTAPQEWESFASARALSTLYQKKLSSLRLTTDIEQDIISRLLPGLTSIISAETPANLIIGGPLAYLFNQLKPSLLSALKQALEAPQSRLSHVLTTNTLPSLSRAKKPEESVIYGAYLYSKQHYNL